MPEGPLAGLRVVEFAGIGPAPFAAMVLADLGADVIRVDRPGHAISPAAIPADFLQRSRRSIVLDLKAADGLDVALALVERADVLIEGLRPGVMERLGLGPEACHERNPQLVYGRMTGWGQTGPLASTAGHDIDYLAIAGALHPIGRAASPPPPPLNLVADFGGGSMFLVTGILAALHARERAGGQVVDAAMVEGTAVLTTLLHSMIRSGLWSEAREANLLDGGAPFYDTYECADGRYMAVGAIEPAFFAALMDGLDVDDHPEQYDVGSWPVLRSLIAAAFRSRSRDEWAEVFAATDACAVPVLTPAEATRHPHNTARQVFVEVEGAVQPAPAPRFDVTPTSPPRSPREPGADTDAVLTELGYTDADVSSLRAGGVVA